MKSYFDYYRERMENNHNVLMKVAQELKERGCTVYSTEWRSARQDGYRNYILAVKDGKRTYVGFAEVPYEWYIDPDCSRHHKTRGLTGENGYDFPFTIDEVLESMEVRNKKIASYYVEL